MCVYDFDQVLELSVTHWFVIYHNSSVAVVNALSYLPKKGERSYGIVYTFVITFWEN